MKFLEFLRKIRDKLSEEIEKIPIEKRQEFYEEKANETRRRLEIIRATKHGIKTG